MRYRIRPPSPALHVAPSSALAGSLPVCITLTILTGVSKGEDIVTTAERLFNQQGFHATGIDQVVREAGVTPRTLYRHFPSKERLILEVLQRRGERFLGRLERCVDEGAASEPAWMSILGELEAWFVEEGDRGCLFLRALGEHGHEDADITQHVLAHKQRGLASLSTRLDACSPEDRADRAEGLMLIIEGAVARAPVIGGAAAVRSARLLAARLLADPERADTVASAV